MKKVVYVCICFGICVVSILAVCKCSRVQSEVVARGSIVKRSDTNSEMIKALILAQEEYLSAIVPRPTGNDVTNYIPELGRRLSIIIENWGEYEAGKEQAILEIKSGEYRLLSTCPLNEVESKYIRVLREKYSVDFLSASVPVTSCSRIMYVAGYNTRVSEELKNNYGGIVFSRLLVETIEQMFGKEVKYGYLNPFFIPSPFVSGTENIRIYNRVE